MDVLPSLNCPFDATGSPVRAEPPPGRARTTSVAETPPRSSEAPLLLLIGWETMTAVLAPTIQTFQIDEFDAARLVDLKGDQLVSVCLPARNEEATVGAIVERVRRRTMVDVPLVDELIVVDDHSTDSTAEVARDAGATVVAASSVLPDYGDGHGKGEALWKSLYVSRGDLVVWCDADIRDFDASFVSGLVGPLLANRDLALVKGFYERPIDGHAGGGGRVTELVARPALSLLFPHLAAVAQPLAGEYAGRREVLEQVPFVQGYGVDIALLIDVAALVGIDRIAQVDLGVRVHRNRTLDELSPQAMAVLQAVLRRADPSLVGTVTTLVHPHHGEVEINGAERPPLCSVR
jgi:glucosyl-3-phosphoglycerate synthase